MDDLSEKLNSILSDSESMNRIREMANSILGEEKKQPEQVEREVKDDLTNKQKELLNIIKNMGNDDINKVIGYAYSLNEKELSTEEKIEKLLKEYKNKN